MEELFSVSQGAEVEVDAAVYSELNKDSIPFKENAKVENDIEVGVTEVRGVLVCKLLQIIKLKG